MTCYLLSIYIVEKDVATVAFFDLKITLICSVDLSVNIIFLLILITLFNWFKIVDYGIF